MSFYWGSIILNWSFTLLRRTLYLSLVISWSCKVATFSPILLISYFHPKQMTILLGTTSATIEKVVTTFLTLHHKWRLPSLKKLRRKPVRSYLWNQKLMFRNSINVKDKLSKGVWTIVCCHQHGRSSKKADSLDRLGWPYHLIMVHDPVLMISHHQRDGCIIQHCRFYTVRQYMAENDKVDIHRRLEAQEVSKCQEATLERILSQRIRIEWMARLILKESIRRGWEYQLHYNGMIDSVSSPTLNVEARPEVKTSNSKIQGQTGMIVRSRSMSLPIWMGQGIVPFKIRVAIITSIW